MASGVYPTYRPFFSFTAQYPAGGGIVGVQLFFVLSGYLITSLLLSENARRGRISLLNFYKRRIRRLYPALLFACAVYALYALWSASTAPLAGAKVSIVRALTYTYDLPNFLGPDSGWLGHTWTLAVEEQFYIVWPCVLVVLIKSGALARAKGLALSGIALTYALSCGIWWLRPDLVNGVTTDLRWDALLAGCFLALHPVRIPRGAGLAGFAVMLCFTVWIPNPVYPWVFPILTLSCAAFMSCARELPLLSSRLLVHVGVVSYSLYLWHVLVLRLGLPGLVSLAASFVLAEASFWFVERPCRRLLFRSATEPHVLVEDVPAGPGAPVATSSPAGTAEA
jgi:peptidoglycan/LPS O-acetylase OafA/YrhL